MGNTKMDVEERIQVLEEKYGLLLKRVETLEGKGENYKRVLRNQSGKWNVKMAYPDVIFEQLDAPIIGFPSNKQHLANDMALGSNILMYITSPVKRIIGYGKVSSPMIHKPNDRWPYQFEVEWITGPCFPGVKFKDIDLPIRPRIGDTNFAIQTADAKKVIALLGEQRTLTKDDIPKLLR